MHVTADRTVEYGLATIGFDDEGVRAQRWDLVRDGIFVGYQPGGSSADGTVNALAYKHAAASEFGVPDGAVFLARGMTLTGLVYGPMSAVLPELFPTNVRYSGSGVSFNIASVLGAAVAPFIATWLTVRYGVGHVGLYLVAMALVSLAAQWLMPETRTASLDTPDTTGVSGAGAAEPQSAGTRDS
jgi:hypothetical protein